MKGLIVYQPSLHDQCQPLGIHCRGSFQYPVIFPDVGYIGHIRGEGVATVKRRVSILHAVPADGFHQVGDLLFLEILYLVSKHIDIRTAGQCRRSIEGAESDICTGMKNDCTLVGYETVEWLPEMRFEPCGQVFFLFFRVCRRFLFDYVVDAFMQSFAFEALKHTGQDIRGEVREGIGHPYQRGTRHVEDNLRESFGLKVRRLGRAAAQDSAELSRHQQRCYLGVQVLILYVDAGAVPGVNSLPVRH